MKGPLDPHFLHHSGVFLRSYPPCLGCSSTGVVVAVRGRLTLARSAAACSSRRIGRRGAAWRGAQLWLTGLLQRAGRELNPRQAEERRTGLLRRKAHKCGVAPAHRGRGRRRRVQRHRWVGLGDEVGEVVNDSPGAEVVQLRAAASGAGLVRRHSCAGTA